MTIAEYTELTGITVSSANEALVTAQIAQSQSILENMLGYTLNEADVNDNQYTEIGKTQTACPCSDSVDEEDLLPPDAVVYAYRLFRYKHYAKFLAIDPSTAVHKVKLVKDGVTYKTLDPSEYRNQYKNNLVKFLEQCDLWCACRDVCDCVQLAVDADWLGKSGFPTDLLQVWANMATFYSDPKNGIKSETLGSHSYTKFDNTPIEQQSGSLAILKKYAGPNGSLYVTVTI